MDFKVKEEFPLGPAGAGIFEFTNLSEFDLCLDPSAMSGVRLLRFLQQV